MAASVPAPKRVTTSVEVLDRKSTRLNSSHSQISYAVFCLKKKKKQEDTMAPFIHDAHDLLPPRCIDHHPSSVRASHWKTVTSYSSSVIRTINCVVMTDE